MKCSLRIILENYRSSKDGSRLGQFFCNRYIKQPWPELYHETNEYKASRMILQWLADHQYYNTLPPKVGH